ncbi:IS3 family transposase [Alteromonas mediterranea]|jgi:transposase|uniref:ISSwp1, transposase OrfA n=2 Tax=Alteromonas mediterranea TaxID=314275 RepID=S5AQD5_9ALTE|nr:IS3 family transposase [Alteromonas mediterranea]AGP79278.1 ISSwp1, transposase OrfA [Alteromonas mediterranea 615]AGP91925.1 ISSwp1, transposase OrfA [Alteromonas mediterranea U8]MBR9784678.1 IS3 family transposase [Gammaproteobacteria bacterium]MDY6885501.1 IS3 family transposase [Pseudomonadota bacterium]AFV83699.1 ISSwp1, transposase OrfA [Alteromonas mediterranea DE1]|tara:strand:- start:160 stop:450 length:291 start_codon:yes stop_codon:yes gene_type:complete
MSQRFTEEFKIQAVKQVIDQGYSVASVSERLGVTSSSLYNWIKSYGPDSEEHKQSREQSDRIKQLEKELKRVTMERDILKEATVFFAGESKKNTRS